MKSRRFGLQSKQKRTNCESVARGLLKNAKQAKRKGEKEGKEF
jgi:hypothetical protein